MISWYTILKSDLYLLRKNKSNYIKFVSLHIFLIYVYMNQILEGKIHYFPFIFYGYFIFNILLEVVGFQEKARNRIEILISSGFGLRKIIFLKTTLIFILASLYNFMLVFLLSHYWKISFSNKDSLLVYSAIIINYFLYTISTFLQIRYEIIFTQRLINTILFLLVVNSGTQLLSLSFIHQLNYFLLFSILGIILLLYTSLTKKRSDFF